MNTYLTLVNGCHCTHLGVSSLLEFLCDGLVGGHDNKDLDGHVEDAHGDQVGDIVPTRTRWRSVPQAREHGIKKYASVPVALAVVQSAAGPEGLVVVLAPADERHGGPEGGEEPDEDH